MNGQRSTLSADQAIALQHVAEKMIVIVPRAMPHAGREALRREAGLCLMVLVMRTVKQKSAEVN